MKLRDAGCTLAITIDASVFLASGPDTFASLSLTVPNVPSLQGTRIHVQSVVFDDAPLSFGRAGMTRAVALEI